METREEYRERIEAKLEELKPKVWLVKQKAEEMVDESREEYIQVFTVLYSKLERVGQSLEELEEANDETWQNFKARVDGALSDLNNSVGNVLSRMG
jgi:hypothetical protein